MDILPKWTRDRPVPPASRFSGKFNQIQARLLMALCRHSGARSCASWDAQLRIPARAKEGASRNDGIVIHRNPVPLQRWHFTTLSPFFSKPLPSQFLQGCFFLMFGPFALAMPFSRHRTHRRGRAT
jgi:hypothetical protein